MQIEMAMKNRQTEIALKMAMGRERFKYYSVFFGIVLFMAPIAAYKNRSPKMLAPLIPMSFGWSFQYDMCYGNLNIRAQQEASRAIKEEPERFFLPQGTGIVDQKEYNKILGIPENYKPKI